MRSHKISPLLAAYFKKDILWFEDELGKGASVNEIDRDGWTVLFYAARDGETNFARLLINFGANIGATDRDLRTPLHLAAQEYRVETASLLLSRGAPVDALDKFGNSPLWRATFESRGRPELILLLLTFGADERLKNKYGVSAIDLAATISNYPVRAIFDT